MKKPEGVEYGGSIQCMIGVELSTTGMRNIVRTYSSKEHPDGYASAEITKEGLQHGAEKIIEILATLDRGEPLDVQEVLACGLAEIEYTGGISMPADEAIRIRESYDKELTERGASLSNADRMFRENFLRQQLVLTVFSSDFKSERWKVVYDQLTGRLSKLEKASSEAIAMQEWQRKNYDLASSSI